MFVNEIVIMYYIQKPIVFTIILFLVPTRAFFFPYQLFLSFPILKYYYTLKPVRYKLK